MGLVLWMFWRFLLGPDESDENFQPVLKKPIIVPGDERQQLVSTVGLHSDSLSESLIYTVVSTGYLTQAYEEQWHTARAPPPSQSPAGLVETRHPEAAHGGEVEELQQQHNEALNTTSATDVANHLPRCRTIARFEYMTQSHSGPHSWFSYPLIPLVFSIHATIFLIGLPI
ncbi:hypothetical protein HD806DRAFT_550970 [Xylariaceae sp. AK1471]|nr:hypothetical protein HD806DRAFT_550970 [Xylariaceae sp. AK1471]